MRFNNLGLLLLCLIIGTLATAQRFSTLVTFDGANGASPNQLAQALDGNLYGTTGYGGGGGRGTVFKVTPTGQLSPLFSFCPSMHQCLDGAQPVAGLVLGDVYGNLYGTTWEGGANDLCCGGGGTLFQIRPTDGILSTVHSFCAQTNCTDGARPQGLTFGFNGQFFGVLNGGGATDHGGLFKISGASHTETTYSICQSGPPCANGDTPQDTLIQATDGNFYGVTSDGGANGYGTIFRMTPNGVITTLYSFCSQTNCADGAHPNRGLVQATDGDFYGTTPYGGVGSTCSSGNCGTVFKMTRSAVVTTLYSFCTQANCTDGNVPNSALLQATDGNFYGTTFLGGTNYGAGTVFRITPSGILTTIYNFCPTSPCTDGYNPASLVQHTNGSIYGTTIYGGINSDGVIFSLSMDLPAFVESFPYATAVGKTVKILGQGLTATTVVAFNGTTATFTVPSDTYLNATVPSGATTGYITVTTPSGTLMSNKRFQVIP